MPKQQSPSQDMSIVFAKLSLINTKTKSLIENNISSLERKMDASERHTVATTKAIKNISMIVKNHITNGLKVSHDDQEYIMSLINNYTKQSGSFLSIQIIEISEKIANIGNYTVPNNIDESMQIKSNEVVVMILYIKQVIATVSLFRLFFTFIKHKISRCHPEFKEFITTSTVEL